MLDEHGKMLYPDAVKGLTVVNGVYMDKDNALYLMADNRRMQDDGSSPFNKMTATLMKFKPGRGRIINASTIAPHIPMKLSRDAWPNRPPELGQTFASTDGGVWVEGAEWLYGGVGYAARAEGGCACANARFALDYFGRSFVPEADRFSVAILDTNGNVVLRLGRYGNVEDGQPLVSQGGPPTPRSIGGDEIALFHACYVATHTDRRLFIADAGNGRILSVKLGYHAEAKVALKDVPDAGK